MWKRVLEPCRYRRLRFRPSAERADPPWPDKRIKKAWAFLMRGYTLSLVTQCHGNMMHTAVKQYT